jgi:hypothetical protein
LTKLSNLNLFAQTIKEDKDDILDYEIEKEAIIRNKALPMKIESTTKKIKKNESKFKNSKIGKVKNNEKEIKENFNEKDSIRESSNISNRVINSSLSIQSIDFEREDTSNGNLDIMKSNKNDKSKISISNSSNLSIHSIDFKRKDLRKKGRELAPLNENIENISNIKSNHMKEAQVINVSDKDNRIEDKKTNKKLEQEGVQLNKTKLTKTKRLSKSKRSKQENERSSGILEKLSGGFKYALNKTGKLLSILYGVNIEYLNSSVKISLGS